MNVDAFLGPQANYVGNIPDPKRDLKVGGKGSMEQLATNTGALIQYMDVLSSGYMPFTKRCVSVCKYG